MDDYERDYNIEDTAKLMTEAAKGGSKKLIILIVAAIIAVAVVAVFGFRTMGEKRYNDQIAIAEKSMKEGNYEQAEEEYLTAVSMNKRKVKAREGLAYAYLMQGEFEEAVEIYDGLSNDTGDPQYETARNDAEQHRVTSNPRLVVETAWREVAIEDVPYADFFRYFVDETVWGGYNGPFSYDPDVLATDYLTLDNMFSLAFYGGPVTRPAEDFFGEEDDYQAEDLIGGEELGEKDPKGYYYYFDDDEGEEYYEYNRADKERVDTDLKRVFNFTDDQIETCESAAETDDYYWYYAENGYYYRDYMADEHGVPSDTYEITGILTNGVKYCVKYDAGLAMETTSMDDDYDYEHIDRSQEYFSYYEMLEYKDIDGETYLTMNYNGPEEPEELKNPVVVGGEGTSADAADAYASYLQVLRDNEEEIKSYSWQLDENDDWINKGLTEYMTGDNNSLNYIESPRNKCVALYDLNDDGVPELLFMSAENGYLAGLYIYTYKDGKAVKCSYTLNSGNDNIDDIFQDVAVAGGTNYMIYAGKRQGTFYIAHSMTDEYESLTSNEMFMSADGKITQAGYVHDYFSLISSDDIDEYSIDGKAVSHDEGVAAFKENGEDYEMILLFSGNMKELSVSSNTRGSTAAMTYIDAISWLEKQ